MLANGAFRFALANAQAIQLEQQLEQQFQLKLQLKLKLKLERRSQRTGLDLIHNGSWPSLHYVCKMIERCARARLLASRKYWAKGTAYCWSSLDLRRSFQISGAACLAASHPASRLIG